MSMWTTSSTGLETALAAAIGSTLQQHTITNNLKGQTHIVHIGNGGTNGTGAHHHHHNNNNNSNHSSSHHHTSHHPAHHTSQNSIQQSVWNRNSICTNHQKVRIELILLFCFFDLYFHFTKMSIDMADEIRKCLAPMIFFILFFLESDDHFVATTLLCNKIDFHRKLRTMSSTRLKL